MLALGLVRAASQALSLVEPKLTRASELVRGVGMPRAAAGRTELTRLIDDLNRSLSRASFEGYRLLEGGNVMFTVGDAREARQASEPLRIALPDLTSVVLGVNGLGELATRSLERAEGERMAERIHEALTAGKLTLREAAQQLSVLLAHLHQQRSHYTHLIAHDHDLAAIAVLLGQRVVHAGLAALAAQGDLSTRSQSLVLNADEA
jgi:hypothetical protein